MGSRRLKDNRAFVRIGQAENLRLDFSTPPKRPAPNKPIERMIKMLDESKGGK